MLTAVMSTLELYIQHIHNSDSCNEKNSILASCCTLDLHDFDILELAEKNNWLERDTLFWDVLSHVYLPESFLLNPIFMSKIVWVYLFSSHGDKYSSDFIGEFLAWFSKNLNKLDVSYVIF